MDIRAAAEAAYNNGRKKGIEEVFNVLEKAEIITFFNKSSSISVDLKENEEYKKIKKKFLEEK